MKMRRNFVVVAVAIGGICAAPGAALAQQVPDPAVVQPPITGVTQFYGGFDLSLMNYKLSTSANGATPDVKRMVLYNSGLRTIFGFRHLENLGPTTGAWIQAESTLFAEGRQNAQPAQPSINLGGRNSGIGLRNTSIGDVMVGQWDSPYKLNTYPVIIPSTLGFASVYGSILGNATGVGNADTTGSLPNPQCQNLPTTAALSAAQPLCTQTEASTTGFARRLSDTLQYWSPIYYGAQFKLATQMNEAKASAGPNAAQNPRLWSSSVTWARGPALVGVAYETHRDFQFAGGKDNAMSLTASYQLAGAQVGAYVERINTNGPAAGLDVNARNFGAMGTYNVGAGQIIAAYARANDPSGAGVGAAGGVAKDSGGKVMLLGYRYNMSKRTNVYAVYYKIDNNAGATRVMLGAPNNSFGQPAAITAGQDTTAIGAGIAHAF